MAISDKEQSVKDRGYWTRLAGRRLNRVGRGIHDDIEELLDRGFSKGMIGDLLQAGATEVMRWRSTGVCLPEEEKKASRLLAFCDMLEDRFGVASASDWFERWLVGSCIINMQEIYRNDGTDLALEFAAGRITAEQVLDTYDPSWRDVPPSMWEVAAHPNGEQYIRMRGEKDDPGR